MGIGPKIISLFQRVSKAEIVKVFSFTAMSTVVKMLTGLISVKVVAVIIGPVGIALLGQLNNFLTIATSVACGGINSGITKYVSEHKEDESQIKRLLSTALRITVLCSVTCGLGMVLLCRYLSEWIMLDVQYWYVFVILGLTIIFQSLNAMLLSIINGFKEYKKFVRINIIGSIVGLIFSLTLVLTWGLQGALIGAVTFSSIMLVNTTITAKQLHWFNLSYFREKFDTGIAKKYFRYTLMTLTTALTVPVSQMLLRGYVISEISAVEAGWWEAMNRISAMYLMIITTSFSVYYLPRLSEITEKAELRAEIIKSYKLIIPALLVSLTVIYFTRFIIIKILFTDDFLPMADLFIWQLLGDFFKISSWLLAFLMVAKSMTKAYISTEIIFSTLFVGLGFLLIHFNGVIGLTQAYFANYVLYMLCMIMVTRSTLK